MNSTKLFRLVIGFTLVALLLGGCSGARVEPTTTPIPPSPTSQPEPTEASRPAAPVSSNRNQDIEQAVDEFISPYVEDGYFSGAILIARGGDILVSKGYGMANRELDVPNTPQTKFRLASNTKQFTAMAILLLQEQGHLSVQDPVCDYIPNCPEAWQPITIHHLLTHTSGMLDFTTFPDYNKTMASRSTVEETLKRFRDKPLKFTPGARFEYSNSGYLLNKLGKST